MTENATQVYERVARFIKKIKTLIIASIATIILTIFASFAYGSAGTFVGAVACGIILYYIHGLLEDAEKKAEEATKGA